MFKGNKKSNKFYFWSSATALVVIVVLVLLLGASGGSSKIVISSIDGTATIFVDSIEKKRVSGSKENLAIKGIASGNHTVLIAKDGFWPWLKEVRLEEKETLVLSPFFVPQDSSGLFIPNGDPEYSDIVSKFSNTSLPTFEDRKISKNGNTSLWVDGSSLFVEWVGEEEKRPEYFCNEFGCHNVIVPLGVGGDIRNVAFYKDREDVFIVSFGTGVFAIEADTTGNQNFQPIFEGTAPDFVLRTPNSLYVLDREILLQVEI